VTGLKKQVGSAMMWSVIARAGRFVLGMVSSVIVVRSLGAHDYGVLSLVRNILMFAVIVAGGGMGQALLKFLPGTRVARDGAAARRLIRTAVGVNLLFWAILVAAAYALRQPIERAFPYEGLGVVAAAAVALSLFELFFLIISRVLEAGYDTKRLGIASLAGHVVLIAALLVLLPRGWGVLGVLVATAAGNLFASVMLVARIRRNVAAIGAAGVEAGTAEARATDGAGVTALRLFRFSAPLVAIGFLIQVVWRQSETLFLGHFRTAAEAGFFDLAYRLPQTALEFVPTAVWPLVMAGFSEVYARNASDLRVAIDRYYRMLFLLCMPICVTGVVLGGRLITVFYGTEMEPAAVPAQLFFAVFTVSFLGTPLSMTLYVLEKTHVILIVYLCLAVVNVGLDLLIIPSHGVAGAIVPVSLVTAAAPLVYRLIVARYVDGVRIPLGFIARTFLGSGAAFLLVPFVGFVDGVMQLAGAAVVAGFLILFGFKVFRVIGEKELEMLGAVPIPFANRILRFIAASP
jgi:O-antigen/teichoic acid export membrane protein